jgi:tRNA-dihydrouridine synthase A
MCRGVPLRAMTRHVLGLFQGVRGARAWRRMLSDASRLNSAGPELLLEALALVEREAAAA